MRTLFIISFISFVAAGCAHINLQYDCKPVGTEPKTGKVISSCD